MKSLEEVNNSIDTSGNISSWRRFFLFLGPAFMVCVGYMDPGNWATDIAGGSQFGYSLLWVLLMSNFIALLLQSLSARLGIVRGRDLAQASRETYPALVNLPLYFFAEIAIAACDLAEVLGMAIGLKLLFGFPLLWGVSIAVFDTLIILYLQRKGIRYMELFIFSLVTLIGICFFIELIFAKPDWQGVFLGFVPTVPSHSALYVAIAIIGATVMPHNLYLHSSLVQTRRNGKDEKSIRQAIKYNFFDSAIALNLAFFVNISILIVAAAVFYKNGFNQVTSIENAHAMLAPLMGKSLAPILFALALIASGQSSTITGTLAGQIVMEGYLDIRIAPWVRRLITRSIAVVPAFLVIFFLGESKVDEMLIFSQAILSFQLGFAVIPLIHFVSNKTKMGAFAISPLIQGLSWLAASIIIFLNLKFGIETIFEIRNQISNPIFYYVILPLLGLALLLLMLTFILPLIFQKHDKEHGLPHGFAHDLPKIEIKKYPHILVCIDFSNSDLKAIQGACNFGNKDSQYTLLHVVESAAARFSGNETSDFETQEDLKNLQIYAQRLSEQGFHFTPKIGFGYPKEVIPEVVKSLQIDLLVIGSHGHSGFKDLIYGETISAVQHKVSCPVLIT